MSSPCHVELVLAEKDSSVKAEKVRRLHAGAEAGGGAEWGGISHVGQACCSTPLAWGAHGEVLSAQQSASGQEPQLQTATEPASEFLGGQVAISGGCSSGGGSSWAAVAS